MRELWSRMKQALWGEPPAPRYAVGAQGFYPDFDEEDAITPSQPVSLGKLVELLASKLGADQAAALAQQAIQAADRNMGEAIAFASGTSIDVEFALSLYLDWNSSNEVEWQINRVLETLKADKRWHRDPDVADRSLQATFKSLEDWLALHDYHIWHVKTEGDDALLFPIERKNIELAARLAGEFGLQLFTLAESEPYYGAIAK